MPAKRGKEAKAERRRKIFNKILIGAMLIFIIFIWSYEALTWSFLGKDEIIDSLTVKNFSIVNDDGKSVIRIGTLKGGPYIYLINKENKIAFCISNNEDGTSILMCDQKGSPKLSLSVAGKPNKLSETSLCMFDQKDNLRVRLGTLNKSTCLNLYSENYSLKNRAKKPQPQHIKDSPGTCVRILTEDQYARVRTDGPLESYSAITVDAKGIPKLFLNDANNKAIFQK